MTDTMFRQWTMLRQLPRAPRRATTAQITHALAVEGFSTSRRTVERDLEKLSSIFGYTCDTEARTNHWYWPADFKAIDIPGLEPNTALAFSLAERHLSTLLPPATLDLLQPYFARARDVLDSNAKRPLTSWKDKIRVLGAGPALSQPAVDTHIQRRVYDALLHERRVAIDYRPRQGEIDRHYEFSPLGLVSREGVLYLVGPLWEYDNVVQLALHRLQSLEMLDTPTHRPSGFDLDGYISSQQGFNYPTGEGRIELVLEMDAQAAHHLAERPLEPDQTIEPRTARRSRITARVVETDALAWWLLGFGPSVEVVEPVELRDRVHAALANAAAQYC